MNKQKWVKIGLVVVAAVVPFGLVTVGGYYGYKEYRKRKKQKALPPPSNEDDKKN